MAIKRRAFPGLGFTRSVDRTWAAQARPVTAPPFALTFTHGADGTVTVHAPGQAEGMLDLQLRPGVQVGDVRINGVPTPVMTKPGQWTRLVWQAAPEGVMLSFRPAGPGALDVRYAESTPHWPAQAAVLPPMPAKLMPWSLAGSTVVTGTRRLSW
jgi:hypothetical protein